MTGKRPTSILMNNNKVSNIICPAGLKQLTNLVVTTIKTLRTRKQKFHLLNKINKGSIGA